ncbi:MAG: GNAT family N-acetyltransferase [Anaerolineales bacterium]|nr:GNAT family N-acetyltransferase [Anaerolineales bacterium]
MKLTGKRLILRDPQLRDLEAFAYWFQPGRAWQKTDGPYYPSATAEEVAAVIAQWEQAITAQDWPELRQRLVIADAQADTVMGTISRYWISQETNWAAIGIGIYNPEDWGKGYGYEALGLWCQYLFDQEPKFVRLDLRTWSGNIGMMKLAEKLGFKKEAVFRMARIVEGEYYDGLGYGVLRSEWEAYYPKGFFTAL